MDKIIEKLPESMLWVGMVLILAQIVIPNLDKLVAVVRREDSVEAVTRDVPTLIERRKALSEAGYEHLAGMITIYLNGVVAPKTFAQLNRESSRQIAKHQPFWVRNLWVVFVVVYVTLMIIYYTVTQSLSPSLTAYLQNIGLSTGLAYITYLVGYTGGFLALNSACLWALKKVGPRVQGRTDEATLKWKIENGIPTHEAADVTV